MQIAVITILPQMFAALKFGVVGRGLEEQVQMHLFDPRDYTDDRYRSVDDRPYGGGPGMVMMVEPLVKAVEAARSALTGAPPVVYLTPAGVPFQQDDAVRSARLDSLILICGRFEGVDQRFIDRRVDFEWSIGDYVVSGGELPAMVVIDAITRQIPGVLGNQHSTFSESHLDGMLEYPQYTRPEKHASDSVPAVLLSGDHGRIGEFKRREAIKKTFATRPELLTQRVFDENTLRVLAECLADPMNQTILINQEKSDAKKQGS